MNPPLSARAFQTLDGFLVSRGALCTPHVESAPAVLPSYQTALNNSWVSD